MDRAVLSLSYTVHLQNHFHSFIKLVLNFNRFFVSNFNKSDHFAWFTLKTDYVTFQEAEFQIFLYYCILK